MLRLKSSPPTLDTTPKKTATPPSRNTWLLIGAVFGFAIASMLPSEPAYAQVMAPSEKFAMAAVPTQTGQADAIFVVDYLTGRLYGAQFSSNMNRFSAYYARNLADDFDLAGQGEPQFTILPAFLNPRVRTGGPVAVGGLYIGELTSGKVCLYAFSVQASSRTGAGAPTVPIRKVEEFSFRQAA